MIDIYGIYPDPKSGFRCAGCEYIIKLCKENDIQYNFIDVTKTDKVLDANILDRDKIVELAARAKFRTLRITYPVIFESSESNVALDIVNFKLKFNLN